MPIYDSAQLIEDNIEKLEAVFMKIYVGSKDGWEVAFDNWLSNLSNEEVVEYIIGIK